MPAARGCRTLVDQGLEVMHGCPRCPFPPQRTHAGQWLGCAGLSFGCDQRFLCFSFFARDGRCEHPSGPDRRRFSRRPWCVSVPRAGAVGRCGPAARLAQAKHCRARRRRRGERVVCAGDGMASPPRVVTGRPANDRRRSPSGLMPRWSPAAGCCPDIVRDAAVRDAAGKRPADNPPQSTATRCCSRELFVNFQRAVAPKAL